MLEEKLRLKAPLMVQFEITPACNNNCSFCYNFWEHDPDSAISRKTAVDGEKLKKIMNVMLEREVLAVCFTGGEPLLAEESLFELLEMAHQNGVYTSINTNGRLASRQNAERLQEYGLNSVLVSLHGDSKEVHEEAVGCGGAFSQTLEGISNLVDAALNATVNYVSTQKNVDKIIPTAEMLEHLGVKNMTVTPLLPFPGVKAHQQWAMKKEQFRMYFDSLVFAKEKGLKIDSTLPVAPCVLMSAFPNDYQKYLEVLSRRVCMAGVTFMVVSPEGFNRACIQAPQLEKYGANVSQDFQRAWKNAYQWSDLNLITAECSRECYALASCGGGCRTSSLAINASVSGKTMYMGKPLQSREARPFVDGLEVTVDRNIIAFRKKKNIKRRDEKFGSVLANASNQSFVFLDKAGVQTYNSLPEEFATRKNNRGIYVLYAAGIIELAGKENLPLQVQDVSVIPASGFYQRLAGRLPCNDKIRMLRADTGERIYF